LSNFAAQCALDTRLHFVASDVLYAELIDAQSGAALAFEEGVEGELVLTHLQRDCQPLVRFRSGDIIAVDSTGRCECGFEGLRFRVVGRSDDMVVVRGVNIFPSMVASVINGFKELSGNYRILLDTRPPYDVLPLAVELAADGEADSGLAQALEAAIRKSLGASARVAIQPAHSFELSEGKTRRVIRSYQ
jgi:phenylacetate-CoA ligase